MLKTSAGTGLNDEVEQGDDDDMEALKKMKVRHNITDIEDGETVAQRFFFDFRGVCGTLQSKTCILDEKPFSCSEWNFCGKLSNDLEGNTNQQKYRNTPEFGSRLFSIFLQQKSYIFLNTHCRTPQ